MIADGVYSREGASRPEVEPADRATCTRRGIRAAFWSDSRAGTRTGTAFAIDRAGRNSLRLSRISLEEAVLLLSAEESLRFRPHWDCKKHRRPDRLRFGAL
jgi:hypothetical protein